METIPSPAGENSALIRQADSTSGVADTTSMSPNRARSESPQTNTGEKPAEGPYRLVLLRKTYHLVARIAEHLDLLRKGFVNCTLVIAVCLLAAVVYHDLKTDVVFVEPFDVPPSLEAQGYSGRVLANKLVDEINSIRADANAVSMMSVTPIWSEKEIKTSVPGAGVSVSELVYYIKRSAGHLPLTISGEFVVRDRQSTFTIRASGRPPHVVVGRVENIQSLLHEGAKYVYKITDPYFLAYYLYRRDKDECLVLVQYMLSHAPTDDDAGAYRIWAALAFDQGDYLTALEKLRISEALNSKESRLYVLWAIVLEHQENYTQMEQMAAKAAKLDPDDAIAFALWGKALASLGKPMEAVNRFQRAIKLDPSSSVSYVGWSYVLAETGDFTGALDKLQRAKDLDPDATDVYLAWAWVLERQGNYAEASDQYKKASEIEPVRGEIYFSWGMNLSRQHKPNEAARMFKKAATMSPNRAEIYLQWGISLIDNGDYKEGIAKLHKAIEVDQDGDVSTSARDRLKELGAR